MTYNESSFSSCSLICLTDENFYKNDYPDEESSDEHAEDDDFGEDTEVDINVNASDFVCLQTTTLQMALTTRTDSFPEIEAL